MKNKHLPFLLFALLMPLAIWGQEACLTPTNVQSMAVYDQAYVYWTPAGNETSWEVAFSDEQGFTPDASNTEPVSNNYYLWTNLTPGVTYYARVRTVCGEEDYSEWSEECSFTTSCMAPQSFIVTGVNYNSATFNWYNGGTETAWQLVYSTDSDFDPDAINPVTVDHKPYTLEGLTANTTYYAYLRAVCSDVDYSEWSNKCSFTPTYQVTVYDDTDPSYLPIYLQYTNYTQANQYIIPSSSLSDLPYGYINQLKYYMSNATASWDGENAVFEVYLGEMESSEFIGNTELAWTDMTMVYSGSLTVSEGEMTVVFGQPYQYQGENLVVGFKEITVGTGGSSNLWVGNIGSGSNAIYSIDGGGYMSAFSVPKTTIYYTPGTAPTCMKPSNLNISQTSSSAILTWTAGEDETHWNVQYKEASALQWSAPVAIENTPTYTLNNLSPITNYQVRVQADCGGGDTSGWISGSFTTSCGPTGVPYSHDFDNDETGSNAGLPQCWTKINDSEDPSYSSYPYVMGSNSYSGSNCLFFMRLYNSTALNQMAVLPEMNADLRTLQLSFYAKIGSEANEPLSVGVMTDPEDASTFVKIEDVTVASNEYAQYTVSLDGYAGVGRYIALKCERGSSYNQIFVDDISVTSNGICFAPENPQIGNITANSAVFTWTAGSDITNWQVQYKKTSDADWSESIAVSETPSFTLSNLATATEYQARVRTDCGNDNYSDWVTSDPFQTDCGYMELPYSHYFDSDATGNIAPTCWYFSEGQDHRVYENTGTAHSGSKFLLMQKPSNESACYVVLPVINTTDNPINTLKLTFWARMWNSTYLSMYLSIGVMTDPNDIDTYQFITSVNVRNSYSLHEIYFDDYVGEAQYIVFRCFNTSNYFCIDDVEVSLAPTCRQPLELSGGYSYNAHEANIRWKTRDLRQCNYQVSYSTTEGFNPEEGTIVDVEYENTLVNAGTDYRYYDLTCLNANTTYYFYVRANCGNGDFSEWSDDYASITTGEACLGPNYVMTTEKNTYVKFEWNGDVDTEWEFQYKESSSEEWITPADFVVTPGYELYLTYTLHGLTPGTEYDARLRKHCGMCSCPDVDDGYSDWLETSFTTYNGCWDGDPWMCTSHLGTQATLRWSNNAPDMRWQIRYRLSNEYDYPEGNIVTTEILPEASLQQYTLTGLETNSTYYWQVRGYCGEEDQSDWSDEDYFFTRSTDGFITVDKAHPYYEDFENGMPDDWSRMNLYNYNLEHYDTWQRIESSSGTWESFPPSYCISSCRECMSWASPGSMILMPAIHIDENATSAVLSFWSKDAFNDSDARGTKLIWVNGNYLSTDYTAFDLGSVYQKGSKAGYWRQCFVNLDDYIGQTVIIAFDYVVTHNYNNYDWWVDNVRLQVFDKVGGGGENVTSGDWNSGDFWGGSVPDADDDVIINANVTIPDGVVAEANQIVINTDTLNVGGGRAQKFGKLTIADGGQLKVNNPVEVTTEKTVTPWTNNPAGGWHLIASPVNSDTLNPDEVNNMLTNQTEAPYSFDLYRLNGTTWENYHAHHTDQEPFYLENGQGYLYANDNQTTLQFTGPTKPYDTGSNTVAVSEGWNLIGNPYTFDVYPNTSYYVMNSDRTQLDPQTKASSVAVKPCEGIIVKADMAGSVAFYQEAQQSQETSNGNLLVTLAQNKVVDKAIVSFDKGDNLEKFYFGDGAKLYIPQDGKDYAIAFSESHGEMPVNFKATENGEYTITVSSPLTSHLSPLTFLHLIDNLTGVDVDLLAEPSYTFTAQTSDYASRFRLVFRSDAQENEDFAFISNGELLINGTGTLQVIDALGRTLVSKNLSTLTSHLSPLTFKPGVYVLRLINGERVKTQKIVIR